MHTLAIHIKLSDKGFQLGGKQIVLTYYKEGEGGLISRCLTKRSVTHQYVLKRSAEQDEVDSEGGQYRVKFISYSSWEALINDERKFTTSQDWFNSLDALRKKYPEFDIKPIVKTPIQTRLDLA